MGSGRGIALPGDDGDLDACGDPAAALNSLPYLPGHGLWVAREVADQMQTLSGPRGTRVTLTFGPPPRSERGARRPPRQAPDGIDLRLMTRPFCTWVQAVTEARR